jgi:hypothetical protein
MPELATKQLAFQKMYSDIRVAFYYPRPAREPYYVVSALTLLDFTLEPSTTPLRGTELAITTWWSLKQQVVENYVLRISLIDQMGVPHTGSDALVATSFTESWSVDSLHLDRRKITIPPDLPAGSYNLVLSMHGTGKDNSNIQITHNDGSPVGEYGYLTTISVQP